MKKFSIDFKGDYTLRCIKKLLFIFAHFVFVNLCRLLQEAKSEKDSGPHDMIHGTIDLLFCGELISFFKDFLELHYEDSTAGHSILAYHLFQHFINDH